MAGLKTETAFDKTAASIEADRIPEDQLSRDTSTNSFSSDVKPKVPWYAYIWDYDPGRSKEEKAFVQRLDFCVLTILSLGYLYVSLALFLPACRTPVPNIERSVLLLVPLLVNNEKHTSLTYPHSVKNLDQNNVSNAYVSGMKEDLHMNGNQLNLVDVAWTCGYVVGQIPSQIVLTKVRPSIWIPSCELVWTMLTFCLAAVSKSNHVIAIRFFVGLLESIFYPAAHMILGSWYKPSELAKRACIFHASSAAASMFSGYLQAGVYKNMNGLQGLPGWKWLFIMDGVISLPIAIAGLFLIPDLPENTRAFYLRKDQVELAQKRMSDIGRAPRSKLGWSAWKRIFGRWHVYLLTILYIIFINASPSTSVQPFTLWLKATGKYSVELINVIPTSQYAVQLVLTLLFAVFSDYWRNRPALMSVSTFWGFFTAVVLAVWTVPDGLKWFAFEMVKAAVPYGPISMAWANEICSTDAEERAIVLGIMNAFGYAVNAWLPLLVFPAVDAPQFHKGFIFSSVMYVVQAGITWLVWWMYRRDLRQKAVAMA